MAIFSRNKIGLALGSGGPRGLAHIGVIKTLIENKIPIDYISGTSAGALVGGLYSYFRDISKIQKIAEEMNATKLLPLLSDISLRDGLIKGSKIEDILKEHVGNTKIEDLKIPFVAVSVDLMTGKAIYIKKGPLYRAIRASISVPIVFSPVKSKGRMLVDGGIAHPVPVEAVRRLGAEKVIAVNLNSELYPEATGKEPTKPQDILYTTMDIFVHNLALKESEKADVVLSPIVKTKAGMDFMSFTKADEITKIGEKTTKKKIRQIRKLVYNPMLRLLGKS
ncbi:patatin-like phospholipase family protein [Candidatus Dojkabacteria bacterium]|nr:patatin-like phospholipase family protein [Candidatus Dojkabacteria bacterium]